MAKKESDRQRIESDIIQFYQNAKEIEESEQNREILDLARRYCEDAKYFLAKKDFVTAFGCINYAHGLIDALRKMKRG
ncbi:MAG: DUF357 domain-containing protein [Candidatus Micrarchaeota archaeon]|nr:DUF357 domain-containing protein [Candidatus Micrarchaeota archaeon]